MSCIPNAHALTHAVCRVCTGLVILMVDEKMEPAVGRAVLKGKADKLNSAFHLTYNMVLNLLRVEEINPEIILEKSFFQFQNQQAIPELEKRLALLTAEHDVCMGCGCVAGGGCGYGVLLVVGAGVSFLRVLFAGVSVYMCTTIIVCVRILYVFLLSVSVSGFCSVDALSVSKPVCL